LKLFSTQANVIYEELSDSCECFEKSLNVEKPLKLFDVMAFSISLYIHLVLLVHKLELHWKLPCHSLQTSSVISDATIRQLVES